MLEINADAARDSGLEYTGSTTREARATLTTHIAAQDAEIARLRKAMEYALWQHKGGGSPMHNHWSAVLHNALLPLEAK